MGLLIQRVAEGFRPLMGIILFNYNFLAEVCVHKNFL